MKTEYKYEEHEFPKEGDKLFIATADDGEERAWLNKGFSGFGTFSVSYHVAAKTLLDNIREDSATIDYKIHPIIFLIRQYVELSLKELIQGLDYCSTQEWKLPPTHHFVDKLWLEFKKRWDAIGEESSDENFKAVDEIIAEINRADPRSMAFRYPVDTKGKEHQFLEYINIKNIQKTFTKLYNFFDALSNEISQKVANLNDGIEMSEMYNVYWADADKDVI